MESKMFLPFNLLTYSLGSKYFPPGVWCPFPYVNLLISLSVVIKCKILQQHPDPYHKKQYLTIYWARLLFWGLPHWKAENAQLTLLSKGQIHDKVFLLSIFQAEPQLKQNIPPAIVPLRCSVTLQRPGALRVRLMSHPLTDIIRAEK